MSAAVRPSGVAISLFLAAPLLMALNLLIARDVRGVVPPMTLAFCRWAIAALVLAPFAGRGLWRAVAQEDARTIALMALLGGALTVGPQYYATTLTSAGHIGLIFASSFSSLWWKTACGTRGWRL